MSIHDYSHGPYDDYDPNWELYISDSSEDIDSENPGNWDFHEICKEYMKDYNDVQSSYKSFAKLYKVIEILEAKLNKPNEERLQQHVNSDEFNEKYKPIVEEETKKEFHTLKEAFDYVYDLDLEVDKFADDLFQIRCKVCDHLRNLADEAKIDLSNWGKLKEFLSLNQ